jgi:alkanesulfonate monooxygenase SsuD/methylene tetrahydromethanopterin reductase-like flavin-dependent oxidoreductase (luciferase family)
MKAMLQPASGTSGGAPGGSLLPPPRQSSGIPLWIGSWGSRAGMRRVARAGDGWLASAYSTTPEAFTAALEVLGGELLSRYARAGCQRVHFWPVGDEQRQIELIADQVMPQVSC